MTDDKLDAHGVVTHSAGSWYQVTDSLGHIHKCRAKGKLRTQGLKTTNPIAVGDHVSFKHTGDGTAVIQIVKPRRNYIVRKAVKLSKRAHIIASNIDRAYLIITLTNPPTSTGFIDRFLVTADAYDIPVTLVFNKIDVYQQAELTLSEEYKTTYESLGYECLFICALLKGDLDKFRSRLTNKVNLLSGHSGVGKSTLVNGVEPNLMLKTSQVSEHYNLGRHTTTFAEMFPLSAGGFIVDTPGIKGLGIIDIEKQHLGDHFPRNV